MQDEENNGLARQSTSKEGKRGVRHQNDLGNVLSRSVASRTKHDEETIELRTLQRFLQHCTITSKDLNFLEGTHVCGNPDIRKHID